MKKKYYILCLILICACIFVACQTYKYYNDPTYIGSIKEDITEKTSSTNSFTFTSEQADRLDVNYTTSVTEGSIVFKLFNEENQITHTFEIENPGSKTIDITETGEYTLFVTYEDFIGNYQIKITKNPSSTH